MYRRREGQTDEQKPIIMTFLCYKPMVVLVPFRVGHPQPFSQPYSEVSFYNFLSVNKFSLEVSYTAVSRASWEK